MANRSPSVYDRLLANFGLQRRREMGAEDLAWIEYQRSGFDPFSSYAQVSQDRLVKYNDYDLLDLMSTISVALDIWAEEASQPDPTEGEVVWVESEKKVIADAGNALLDRIDAAGRTHGIARALAKYGDVFEYLLTDQNGVYDWQFVHPCRVSRVQTDRLIGFECSDLARVVFARQGVAAGGAFESRYFQPWDFVHMRIPAEREGVYGRCYSSDTEVLTRHGWVLFKDMVDGEEVATRNSATKHFEWQKPTAVTAEPYSGPMVSFQSRMVDLLVTPNHRMLLTALPAQISGGIRRNSTQRGEVVVRAGDLVGCRMGHGAKIPLTSEWVGVRIARKRFAQAESEERFVRVRAVAGGGDNGAVGRWTGEYTTKQPVNQRPVEMSGDDYCRLMGAYLSEGNLRTQGGIEIAQMAESKGYGPYGQLLARISGQPAQHNGRAFVLPRRALTEHFRQFGHAPEKFIPDEIMDATPKQIYLFWHYFVLGDGSQTKRTGHKGRFPGMGGKRPSRGQVGEHPSYNTHITTTSRRLADQLVELAQKIGWSASVSVRQPEEHPIVEGGKVRLITGRHLIYTVNARYSKATGCFAVTEEPYSGMVYCVTVPNGIVYVRRNGRPAWCGNSAIEPVRKTAKELQILETMIAVFRIVKGVERNVVMVDVGDSAPGEARKWVERWRRGWRKAEFIDPVSGDFRVDLRGLSIMEDIVIPTRPGSSTRIEKLASSPNVGAVEEVQEFKAKLRTGLGIPKQYLDGETDGMGWNPKEALVLQDARFSKKIQRVRRALIDGYTRLVAIHLTLANIPWKPGDFSIGMAPVNQIEDRLREERWARMGELLGMLLPLPQMAQLDQKIWNSYILREVAPGVFPDALIDALVRVTSSIPGETLAMMQAGQVAPMALPGTGRATSGGDSPLSGAFEDRLAKALDGKGEGQSPDDLLRELTEAGGEANGSLVGQALGKLAKAGRALRGRFDSNANRRLWRQIERDMRSPGKDFDPKTLTETRVSVDATGADGSKKRLFEFHQRPTEGTTDIGRNLLEALALSKTEQAKDDQMAADQKGAEARATESETGRRGLAS